MDGHNKKGLGSKSCLCDSLTATSASPTTRSVEDGILTRSVGTKSKLSLPSTYDHSMVLGLR